MKILVVGSGGREHALAWKAIQSERVHTVYVAPGNAGTACEPGVQNVSIGAEDVTGLLDFARRYAVDLTVVGPEAPLVMGVVDMFREAGLRCLGPTRAAAELEGSKVFAKEFLSRYRIPTAAYGTFSDVDEARAFARELGTPVVIKADGLASGKGVVVARSLDEAMEAIDGALAGEAHGGAGERIVIEEFLEGEELSFIAVVDGETVLPLASSQDHKPRDDNDLGPNTGGMGAYSPSPLLTEALHDRIMREIVRPTVEGMSSEGRRYTGFLYAGLMIAPDGTPRVLEYNVRLGDPEAQPILMRLQSDLVDLCEAVVSGRLDEVSIRWDSRASLGVVLASGGYPGAYTKGHLVTGLPNTDRPDRKVFHAGTVTDSAGRVVTSGGRVLCACALGASVSEARHAAYALADGIQWEDMFHRGDIGFRAVDRERTSSST